MKKSINRKIFLAILVTMLPAILLADGQTNSPNERQIAVGADAGGFQLTISTANKIFQLGEPIHLAISLKNVSSNSLDLYMTQQSILLKITNPDGKAAAETEFGTSMLHPNHFIQRFGESLSPGQSLELGADLTAWFWMTNTGEYSITVSQKLSKEKSVSAGPLKIQIKQRPSSDKK
jgi:hypothetical protein